MVNRQSKTPVSGPVFRRKTERVLKLLSCDRRISVVIVDEREMSRLHKRYLNDGRPTDVMAFPPAKEDPSFLGEVVVSVDAARRVGTSYGNLWQDELLLYICHGILHLLGYRDKTRRDQKVMFKKQDEILGKMIRKWPSKKQKPLS